MTTPFWYNDPTILMNKENVLQFWPNENMSFEEKLNAITRTIIIITVLGFLFTQNLNLIIVAIITLAIIFSLFKLRKQRILDGMINAEGFKNKKKADGFKNITTNPVTLEGVMRNKFHPTTKKNPFGNVLLTDIGDKPNRKPAAPSFNPDINEEIESSVKKQTQMLNPEITNTNKQLYGDLYDNYQLDNSLSRFYSTANTQVSNDQGAYAKFLYGDMPSGKSSGPDGVFARVKNTAQWINP